MTKFLRIPLQVHKGRLSRDNNIKEAIDANIAVIINTPVGTVPCDPVFGFSLQKLRFEMINEMRGTVYSGLDDKNPDYDKKMSGTSKNIQTFAADLNDALRQYEPRLSNTDVSLTYIPQSKTIVIIVKGTIRDTDEDYKYTDTMRLWI